MEFKTIKGVPIVSTGTYPLGTGETTFTADDLASAVLAANDPTVVAPRIKIGHIDKRFENDETLDGEPALGTVQNLTLSDDGQTILGDLADVPGWLADSMPSAYPGRSIEGGFNFEAPSGHHYKLVISDLALLGVTWPGITSLADLKEVMERNGPVATAASGKIERPVTVAVEAAVGGASIVSIEDSAAVMELMKKGKTKREAEEIVKAQADRGASQGSPAKASVAASGSGNRSADERRTMASKGEAMPDGSFPIADAGELSSAIRLARTDAQRSFIARRARALGKADQIPDNWNVKAALDLGAMPRRFADDLVAGRVPKFGEMPQAKWWPRSVQAEEDGSLSILVDTDAGQLLTLPITVAKDEVAYGTPVAVAASSGALSAENLKGPRVLASWPSHTAAGPRKEVMHINADIDRAKLVSRLGLPENADDAAINEALGVEAPETATTEPAAPEAPAASAPALPEGIVAIDAAKLAELEAGAQAGATIAASMAKGERDDAITEAIKGGRIVASSREMWQKRWDVDRDGTRTLLTASVQDGGLAAVIPAQQIEAGFAGDGESDNGAPVVRLLPELQQEVAA